MTPKRPNLNVVINFNNKWEKVGVAWSNDDGSIRIQLNPFVQLPIGCAFNLFKNKTPEEFQETQTRPASSRATKEGIDEDDRPF